MKLADSLGTNPLDLTLAMVAGGYGVSVDAKMRDKIENSQESGKEFFVFVSSYGMNILDVHERSVEIAKIVGNRLHFGTVLWFRNGKHSVVDMKDWKDGLAQVISGQKKAEIKEARRELREARAQRREERFLIGEMRREKRFDEARDMPIYKKMGKRGFNLSFDELKHKREIEAFDATMRNVSQRTKEIASVL